jgi:hypothetical protein
MGGLCDAYHSYIHVVAVEVSGHCRVLHISEPLHHRIRLHVRRDSCTQEWVVGRRHSTQGWAVGRDAARGVGGRLTLAPTATSPIASPTPTAEDSASTQLQLRTEAPSALRKTISANRDASTNTGTNTIVRALCTTISQTP